MFFRTLLPYGMVLASLFFLYLVRAGHRFIVLIAMSVGYYVLIDGKSLPIIIVLVGVNYLAARKISQADPVAIKLIFYAILAADILAWMFFKIPRESAPAAPLGMSFLTFTLIGYQADVFRRKTPASSDIMDLGFFVLWAPKISQGPIERYDRFLYQKKADLVFSNRRITSGCRLILFGLFKKIVVADRLGAFVAFVYDQTFRFDGVEYLLATVFFAFQIYADFSGYTDIARGISRLFGYELSINFRQPYLAKSVREFWTRWHMSLSNWLRDYLYLPLAFWISNRLKNDKYLFLKTEKWIYGGATAFTFFICGIWHGVRATFVVWGLLYGLFLIGSTWTRKSRFRRFIRHSLPSWLLGPYQSIATFALVCAAWIVFRSPTLSSAWMIMRRIPPGIIKFIGEGVRVVTQHESPRAILKPLLMGQAKEEFLIALSGIAFLVAADYLQEKQIINRKIDLWPAGLRWGIYYAMIAAILFFGAFNSSRSFIYVQF
jgi:alginate O-acetyltransferase complex protein AlgI